MNYAEILSDAVVNVVVADADFAEMHGLIPCGDEVQIGWMYDGVNFIAPEIPPPTIQDQIDALEAQQNPRLLREAALGGKFALDKLGSLEADIAALRAKL